RRDFLGQLVVGLLAERASSATLPPQDPKPEARDEMERLRHLGSRGVRVHDPSTIVKCKDMYWIFHTGRGIMCHHSHDCITWESGPRVFSKSPPWVTKEVPANRGGLDFWAPEIVRAKGEFRLYYSVSTFGKNTSVIAMVSSPTLDPNDPEYRW